MDEPRQDQPSPAPPVLWLAAPPSPEEEERRRQLRRRLKLLLAAGLAAFTLAAWLLVRFDLAGRWAGAAAGPATVVRAHLEAINRDDLRAAWEFFSDSYREKLPFDAYHDVVAGHRDAFRTRRVELRDRNESAGRAVLTASVVAADGARYLARFTLVRQQGRWWIDDLRWSADRSRRSLTT